MDKIKNEKDITIATIGDLNVGKTSIQERYLCSCQCNQHLCTIQPLYRWKTMSIDDNKVNLMLWDTAGQDRFKFLSVLYYRSAQGITLVYDITDRTSFDNLKYWINEIEQKANNWIVFLIGNKSDLDDKRTVSFEEGEALAKEFGMKFYETSAKYVINITEVYEELVRNIIEKMKEPKIIKRGKYLRNRLEDEDSNERWNNGW